MNDARFTEIKREILGRAHKHYYDETQAEFTREEIGDNWFVYNKAAKQLEEHFPPLVKLPSSSGSAFRVVLTEEGQEYCKANGIS